MHIYMCVLLQTNPSTTTHVQFAWVIHRLILETIAACITFPRVLLHSSILNNNNNNQITIITSHDSPLIHLCCDRGGDGLL